jgi:hypothetical protein
VGVKKLKNESELLKLALKVGVRYGEGRGAVQFEETDSVKEKVEILYRLLVHDKLMQPIPETKVSQQAMRHKLAIWISRQLPEDHPLRVE